MKKDRFTYSDERFADLQMLRYRLNGFEDLALKEKKLIYCLSQAILFGRDITFDQFGKYNLRIRKTLETIFEHYEGNRNTSDFRHFTVYLKRVWFSNGIYHHYGYDKLIPDFSREYFQELLYRTKVDLLPLKKGQNVNDLFDELVPVMFDPNVLPKRVNKADGEDLVQTSACHFYENVSQKEVEDFYAGLKSNTKEQPLSYGLNSTVTKRNGQVVEDVWKVGGKYGEAIKKIVYWLEKALDFVDNDLQEKYIKTLITYYHTGNLNIFNEYCIQWVCEHQSNVDFINGFIEVYGDPLGLKGTWEGIVQYKDIEATNRTQRISSNAQWFEDHSPIDPRFRKPHVNGVTANVVCAAMLAGDEYPSTAIGINLPNADWIRAKHGSKSVTIGNLTEAYRKADHGNGFLEEFVIDEPTRIMMEKHGDGCDDLHTDLHECLGHGSGRLADGVDPDALKAYGDTIEEARADLFALYYIADEKILELGLLQDKEAYKSLYYSYMMNGLMTQLTRIKRGHQIEEAHMRNRSLIAHWCYEHGKESHVMELVNQGGKTFVRINDYAALRHLVAELLAEIQRIKSEGDYETARNMIEQYAVRVDDTLHEEVLARYEKLDLAPFKGFLNPVMRPVTDAHGTITDIALDYTESMEKQMMRYSKEYGTLI
ncbi:MAG: dihydrofolate reductase [Prevotellaceae bacterium]|nr:dihydrofolate reductase [Prevotellaceae bacterium]MDY6131016.1 dihydrofolate reductase [Prevotella sp.]